MDAPQEPTCQSTQEALCVDSYVPRVSEVYANLKTYRPLTKLFIFE